MSQKLISDAIVAHPQYINGIYDHKAWAKRFVYRYQHGDKTLTTIQIRFSHDALELDPSKTQENIS